MIGVLIFPGFQLLDASGPASVFEMAKRIVPTTPDVEMVALQAGPVRSSCGVQVLASGMDTATNITTLFVAGGLNVEEVLSCRKTLDFVRRLSRRGVRIASVCSGAYVLAAIGLLDGRKATTHWCRTQDFVSRFPRVKLDPDGIYFRDGNVWTSAGVTTGIDLAIAIVAEDYGESVAKEVARQLVLYNRRSGGQTQFSSLLEMKAPTGRFAPLLSWVRENLDRSHTIESLADRACLSQRHFARIFTAETGCTPSKAIEKLRLEVAREHVQSSGDSIERIAERTGFRDPERMRRAFIRAFGQPPQSLRRTARTEVQASAERETADRRSIAA